MNQSQFIREARERDVSRYRDGFEERVAARTPEAKARVAAIYARFCQEHAASKGQGPEAKRLHVQGDHQ